MSLTQPGLFGTFSTILADPPWTKSSVHQGVFLMERDERVRLFADCRSFDRSLFHMAGDGG